MTGPISSCPANRGLIPVAITTRARRLALGPASPKTSLRAYGVINEEIIMTQSTVINDRMTRHQEMLERALSVNGGGRDWRGWKEAGAMDVVDLAAKAPRLEIFSMDLTGDAHFTYGIRMPVPRWPEQDRLLISPAAVFDLHYQEEWR